MPLREYLARFGDGFGCHTVEWGMLLASSREKPGIPLNVPPTVRIMAGQPPQQRIVRPRTAVVPGLKTPVWPKSSGTWAENRAPGVVLGGSSPCHHLSSGIRLGIAFDSSTG